MVLASVTDSVGSPGAMSISASPSRSSSPRVSGPPPNSAHASESSPTTASRTPRASAQSISERWRSAGACASLAAEQAFERLEHERQLDREEHAVGRRVGLHPHGDDVGGEGGLSRGPGVLRDLARLDRDLGLQLRGQRHRQRLAQRLQRCGDTAAQLGREPGRLREVDRAQGRLHLR